MTYEIQLMTAVSIAVVPACFGLRREARRMERERHDSIKVELARRAAVEPFAHNGVEFACNDSLRFIISIA
jgi:hypothetical protein